MSSLKSRKDRSDLSRRVASDGAYLATCDFDLPFNWKLTQVRVAAEAVQLVGRFEIECVIVNDEIDAVVREPLANSVGRFVTTVSRTPASRRQLMGAFSLFM